jgi:hypothetical protein
MVQEEQVMVNKISPIGERQKLIANAGSDEVTNPIAKKINKLLESKIETDQVFAT